MAEKLIIPNDSENKTLKDAGRISFEELFNLDDIQRLQDEFAEATGVASIITHTDGTPITAPSNFCQLCINIIRKSEKGLKNCIKSDAAIGQFHPDGPIVQPCSSGGLWDAGAGITVGGHHIANWLIGQVRNATQSEADMIKYAQEIGVDEQIFIEAFREVPAMTCEHFGKIAQMLFTLANQLSSIAYQNISQARFIAERKQAEKKLRESEIMNLTWLEHSPVCTKIVDLDFNLLYMSSAGIQGLGIEDITPYYGKPYPFDFYPESFRNTMTKNLKKVRETGEIITQEEDVVDLEGNKVWFHSTIVPVNDEKGRIKYFMVVSVDITDRKKAEEKRIHLSTAIEQADETIVITDKQGEIIYTNPAFEHITGFTPEETAGQNINVFKSDKHDESFYENIWNIISSGQIWKGYFKTKKKDGTLYDNAATISPIKDSQGEITAFVNIGRDVTHEIKREEQLRQSQKMESMGTLAGGIAHDFNNLLTAVIGFTELGLDDVEDRPKTQDSLEQVLKAANRAKDLVNQILTFSRSTTISKTSIKTIPIVEEICKFMRSSLPTTIEINQKITVKNDWIVADPTQFHQILINLCTNAGHAMKEKGGELEVTLEELLLDENDIMTYSDLKAGSYLKLTVKDTGHGIGKETLDRIFEPYFTTKEKGEGTGLGLAVVHGIVKDYGGDIKAYSEVDKGTVFHVLFPLIEKVKNTDPSIDSEPIPTGVESIIFVDDEEMLVNLGKKTLEGLGYKVTGFTSAEEAFSALKNSKESYDLVITDKTMPKMTGLDLAVKIRKVRLDIPILLYTGFQDKGLEDKVQKAGITGSVMKPINRQELAVAVREVLGKKPPEI